MASSNRRFYIGLRRKGTLLTAHASSGDPSRLITALESDDDSRSPQPTADYPESATLTFKGVLSSFVSIMDTYRNFIPLMLRLAPLLSSSLSERRIASFAADK